MATQKPTQNPTQTESDLLSIHLFYGGEEWNLALGNEGGLWDSELQDSSDDDNNNDSGSNSDNLSHCARRCGLSFMVPCHSVVRFLAHHACFQRWNLMGTRCLSMVHTSRVHGRKRNAFHGLSMQGWLLRSLLLHSSVLGCLLQGPLLHNAMCLLRLLRQITLPAVH